MKTDQQLRRHHKRCHHKLLPTSNVNGSQECEDICLPCEAEVERVLLCPADQTEMIKKEMAGICVDQCPKCEGIWLDEGELKTLLMAEFHIRQNLSLYIRLGK